MSKRLIDVFLTYLNLEGVTHIFGVPGGLLHPFFSAIEKSSEFDLIVAKHEGGAAFMADGYARVSGKLGVCAATAGPGATNLITGVAVAFSDNVPMLVLTGQAPSSSIGKGAAQETSAQDIDIVGMFKPITKYSASVPSPDRLTHHIRRAMRLALAGRPGPVHLNVPVDFWKVPLGEGPVRPEKYRPTTNLFDRDQVVSAAEALNAASNPVLLVGSGACGAHSRKSLVRLVESIGARVATTPAAKGVFPEDHPLSVGVFGFAGHRTARQLILGDDVDILFCVGTSLNETSTIGWNQNLAPSECLIQLDIDVDRIARHYEVDIALVGDAGTILTELYFHSKRLGGRESRWRSISSPLLDEETFLSPELRARDSTPLSPQVWRKTLTRLLPENAHVFSDIGGHMLFNIHNIVIGKSQRFFLNLHFGSMGHGTAAPIGAWLAEERPTIAIVGDACFTMNGMELLAASEYSVPVVWIVENNQMHGITYHGSKLVDGDAMNSIVQTKPLKIAAIARSMGLFARTVRNLVDFEEAFVDALASNQPAVIEVVVDATIPPPLGDRAKTVGQQDIAGFKS